MGRVSVFPSHRFCVYSTSSMDIEPVACDDGDFPFFSGHDVEEVKIGLPPPSFPPSLSGHHCKYHNHNVIKFWRI